MKRRIGLVTKYVIGAVLSGAVLASMAQTATSADSMPVKAEPIVQTDAVPYWWFHGSVEAGGRDFLNDPQNGFQTATGAVTGCGLTKTLPCSGIAGRSLGGYYQYSDIRPGPFGDVWLSTGSKDGLYQIDVGGKNIGYEDQSYYLDASKAGEHYFNFNWDQSPHVYSTNALTPWVQNGNALTLVPLPAGLPAAITKAKASALYLAPYDRPIDIGIMRDTASVQYRWTPTDAWDIKADYSHLDRTGTQPGAADGNVVNNIMFAKPVDDTTQNYGLNGEYVGTSPWGQKLVFKTGYSGSTYTDHFTDFTVQSPGSIPTPPHTDFATMPTWPSNQANSFNGTLAADLPWKSRYAGTFSYTRMTQNEAFLPYSNQFTLPLPAASLDGDINTVLSNNVVTTKITPELTSKLSYRYYDFKNNTPELLFHNIIDPGGDPASVGTGGPVHTISMGYVKQNAGEELNWRPNKEWNLGAAYGFERYDWTRADVDVTNENSGKIYADWKPESWLTVRSSGYYGNRRYDNYNYAAYVGNFQWAGSGDQYQNSYRQLMIDNRQTWKANVAVDLVALKNVTVTPTFKYQDLSYGVDPTSQQGLADSRSWSGGVDVTYVVNPDTSIMVGYMYEYATQLLIGSTSTATVIPAGTPATLTNETTRVNTFTTLLRYAAIPNKLDTELRYTASLASDSLDFFPVPGPSTSGTPPVVNGKSTNGPFPENTTWFQRLDATATYKFDKEQVAQLGWKGDVKARLHYAWMRNTESNWENDPLAPYVGTQFGTSPAADPWLAWYNPNYNVHMLSASLIVSW